MKSKNCTGECCIDLPLNLKQSATYFEWKLRIVKFGFKNVTNEHGNLAHHQNGQRRYYSTTNSMKIANEIKFGVSSSRQSLFVSSRSGKSTAEWNSANGSNIEAMQGSSQVPLFTEGEVLSFNFDCVTGTLFLQKSDNSRFLLGYVKNLQNLDDNPLYPCVKFEKKGDTIEILSAGPIHNSIHTTPKTSKSIFKRSSEVPEFLFLIPVFTFILGFALSRYDRR